MWHVPHDTWHMTCVIRNMTYDIWQVTHDMWHATCCGGWTFISAPQLLWFGRDNVLKIFSQKITDWLTESVSDQGVCKTALVTPSLLKIWFLYDSMVHWHFKQTKLFLPPIFCVFGVGSRFWGGEGKGSSSGFNGFAIDFLQESF